MTPFVAALAIIGLGFITLTLWMMAGAIGRLATLVRGWELRITQLERDVAILARRRPVAERTGR